MVIVITMSVINWVSMRTNNNENIKLKIGHDLTKSVFTSESVDFVSKQTQLFSMNRSTLHMSKVLPNCTMDGWMAQEICANPVDMSTLPLWFCFRFNISMVFSTTEVMTEVKAYTWRQTKIR